MTNPYREIAEIIDTWQNRTDGMSLTPKRILKGDDGNKWSEVRVAFSALFDIEDDLTERPSYAPLVEELWEHILAPDQSWSGSHPNALSSATRLHLDSLMEIWDLSNRGASQSVDPSSLKELRDLLTLLRSNVENLTSDLGSRGQRLLGLIDECIALLDGESVSVIDVETRVEQILGTTAIASVTLPPDKAGKLKESIDKLGVFLLGFTANAGASVAGALAFEALNKMLGGGS